MHSSAGARAEPASPSRLCRGISLQVTGSIPGSDTWRSPGKSAAVSQELHMPNLGKCRHSGMPSNSHSLVNWTTSAAPRSVLLECMRCVVMLCRSPLGRRDGSRSDATLAARGAPSHNAPRADPPEAGRATPLRQHLIWHERAHRDPGSLAFRELVSQVMRSPWQPALRSTHRRTPKT